MLAPEKIERILRERLLADRIERMKAARAALVVEPLAPMTPEELSAEIDRGLSVRAAACGWFLIRIRRHRADVFGDYAALVVLVTPAVIVPTIIRVPADDCVLAAALAAKADLIASGDAHLLDLKSFHGVDIVTASVAVERVASSG